MSGVFFRVAFWPALIWAAKLLQFVSLSARTFGSYSAPTSHLSRH